MEFVEKETIENVEEVVEEKPARVARVNPNIMCGDCIVTPVPKDERDIAPVDRIVIPKDLIDFSDDDEMVYIIGTKDGKVTKIDGLQNMKKLKTLVLRCCLVSVVEGLNSNTLLEKLELYDNQIENIPSLAFLNNLKILDLSFNSIRTMAAVSTACPLLEELYLAQNKLRTVEGLEALVHLRVLDLGANRIRVIEGLEHNTALKSLWIGKNKIEAISGLETLINLKQLDVQNNRLTTLGDGLSTLINLKELYVACNAITSIDGLPVNGVLDTVDFSTNQLSSVEGIEAHSQLEELWMSKNLFDSYESLAPLTRLPKLNCVYLEHSPIAKDFEYRIRLTAMIPTLEQLDATFVNRR